MAAPSLVLLLEVKNGQHSHAELLSREGFRVVSLPADEADIDSLIDQGPAIIAAELVASQAGHTLAFVRLFCQSPLARAIPFILYGHRLHPQDIERASRAGALWVQLEPAHGAKLAAAIRGILYSLSVRRAMAGTLEYLDPEERVRL